MRRLLVLAALLGLMLTLHGLQVEQSAMAAADPLTLAAIGFVVLAAFTVGELVSAAGIPKITGYILSGIVFGPQISNILSSRVVTDMRVFNTLALGLIAITAGLELDVKATRKVMRTLMATVGMKIPVLLLFVGGTVYGIETYHPFLNLESSGHVKALALIFAVLGIGTSPSITLAVLGESKAKGRLADLTLAIAVVKDLVVVVALAVAIALCKGMISPEGGQGLGALSHVAVELGGSVLAGVVIGVLLIVYLRFVSRELLLTTVATILLSSEAIAALHLELLLVFITAGFVIRNFSHFEHALLAPLTRVSLPVFVVFFTTAGAGVDLKGTLAILPLAIALAVARAVAIWIAAQVGGRIGREEPRVRSNAWMAYIPQAGVTLGLVMVAAQALPELADPIRRGGMAVIAVNLLLGPILLGLALKRAGETPEAAAAAMAAAAVPPARPTPTAAVKSSPVATPPSETASTPLHPDAPVLAQATEDFETALRACITVFAEQEIEPRVAKVRRVVWRTFAEQEDHESAAQAVTRILTSQAPDLQENWADTIDGLDRQFLACHESAPAVLQTEILPEAFLIQESDSMRRRWAKRWTRFAGWVRKPPPRQVPVRLALRYCFERRMGQACVQLGEDWYRLVSQSIAQVRPLVSGRITNEECKAHLDAVTEAWIERAIRDLNRAVDEGLREAAQWLNDLGNPGYPWDEIRLSERATASAPARRRWHARVERYNGHIDAEFDGLRALAAVELAAGRFRAIIEKHYHMPLAFIEQDILPLVQGVADRLEDLQKRLLAAGAEGKVENKNAESKNTDAGAQTMAAEEIGAALDVLLPRRERNRLRGLKQRYRHSTQTHDLLSGLSGLVETMPGSLTIIAGGGLDFSQAQPFEREHDEINVAAAVEHTLIQGFVPRYTEAIGPLSAFVAGADERVEDALAVAAFGLRQLERTETGEDENENVPAPEILGRAREQILAVVEEATNLVQEIRPRIESTADETLKNLSDVLVGGSLASEIFRTSVGKTNKAARRVAAHVRGRLREGIRRFLIASLRLARKSNVPAWLFQVQDDTMDAAAIARFLRSTFPSLEDARAPAAGRTAFTADAIDDVRLATARKRLLENLLEALHKEKGNAGPNILVVGARGSGRSSILNIVELRLARYHVVRLDPRFHHRRDGILQAIAGELGCAADPRKIAATLRRRRTVVLIDDLERYVPPSLSGLQALSEFLDVVMQSGSTTRWVVSIERHVCNLFDEAVDFERAFGRNFALQPLDADELCDCIEARARLASVELEYAPAQSSAGRIERQRRNYYRALARATGGNLRNAMLTHVRGLRPRGNDKFAVNSDPRAALPFLAHIGTEPLACLALLIGHGPLTTRELAIALERSGNETLRHLHPLLDATIVDSEEHSESSESVWRVPTHLDGPLRRALVELGVMQSEVKR